VEVELLTLHPELVRSPLEHSILGRAQRAGNLTVRVHDIRDHAEGRHRQVDDTPYGGGAGMVMKVDVMVRALRAVRRDKSHVVLLGPGGTTLTQEEAGSLAQKDHLVLLCGHYEGVDERVRSFVDQEISIGDYVLTGGELPALVVVDSVARLLPGVLGNPESARDESFSQGLLEYPQYTRPAEFEGQSVPEVLASGDHGAIAAWRSRASVERTRQRRPDLLGPSGEKRGDSSE